MLLLYIYLLKWIIMLIDTSNNTISFGLQNQKAHSDKISNNYFWSPKPGHSSFLSFCQSHIRTNIKFTHLAIRFGTTRQISATLVHTGKYGGRRYNNKMHYSHRRSELQKVQIQIRCRRLDGPHVITFGP